VIFALGGVGVGLSAAVQRRWRMMAAYHYDNVFVPARLRHQAVCTLTDVQHQAALPWNDDFGLRRARA
jgi:hypothetical protein